MAAANNTSVDAGGVLRFSPPRLVEHYIQKCSERLDARRFVISPTGLTLTVLIARVERETAYAGWLRRWKRWGGRRAEDDHTLGKFMDMPFIRSVEYAPYEKRLAQLFPKLRADASISTDPDLNLWYGSDHVRKEPFTSNHEYSVRDIDLETCLRQRIAGKTPLLVGWHNVEVFPISPLRRAEIYVAIPDWWAKYECSRLHYVPTPPVSAYWSGLYKSGRHDRDWVIAAAKTENLVMSLASCFAACKYEHADHSFEYAQYDNQNGGFIVPLSAALMEEANGIWFAKFIALFGSDPAMSLLSLKRSSEIDCGCYIEDELPFLGYHFEPGVVYYIVPRRATKRPKIGGTMVIDFPGRELVLLKLALYASIESCGSEWRRLNGEVNEEEGPDDDDVPAAFLWSYYCSATRVGLKSLVLLTLSW